LRILVIYDKYKDFGKIVENSYAHTISNTGCFFFLFGKEGKWLLASTSCEKYPEMIYV
jgi:hypothetical protein